MDGPAFDCNKHFQDIPTLFFGFCKKQRSQLDIFIGNILQPRDKPPIFFPFGAFHFVTAKVISHKTKRKIPLA